MCSESKLMLLVCIAAVVACSPVRKLGSLRSGKISLALSVPNDVEPEQEQDRSVIIDSIKNSLSDGPIIMNAIRDSESGEMVATDVIQASTVTARFRNVAERNGYVAVEFDIAVPAGMADSKWQLKIYPRMNAGGDVSRLEPVFITGKEYRASQLRGYQRYRNFIASIITDTSDFIRVNQLEIFLKRNFPDTYAMKSDSSFIQEPLAEDLFGVTQSEALRHYTMRWKIRMNDSRKSRRARMYSKYVKDPILHEGIRLDTVLVSDDGAFTYRYVHQFKCRPGLRKTVIKLDGELYENGSRILQLPFADSLTYYISSLSSLADHAPKYRMIVLERAVYDNTRALVDFRQGSSAIDTTLGDNASELLRIRKCIEEVNSMEEFCLDSLVITASCSPEGLYAKNRDLSEARSETMRKYLLDYVPPEWKPKMKASVLPENWDQFIRLVKSDTVMDEHSKKRIISMTDRISDPDRLEREISSLPQYRYLREKVYPKLRSVKFDFYLHRPGMQKDTVHTTELDTTYMAGIAALDNLDYKRAVQILRPYRDYNAALALMAADYNNTAMDVLENLDEESARVCYLKSVILARLENEQQAVKFLELSIAYDPYMVHRANLDPELHQLVKKINTFNDNYYE